MAFQDRPKSQPNSDALLFGAGYRELEEEYNNLRTLEDRARWWLTSDNPRVRSMPIATRQLLHDRLMAAYKATVSEGKLDEPA